MMLLKRFEPMLHLLDALKDGHEARQHEVSRGQPLEQWSHPVAELLGGIQSLCLRVDWEAAAQGRIENLESYTLCGLEDVALRELEMLPPTNLGNVVWFKA